MLLGHVSGILPGASSSTWNQAGLVKQEKKTMRGRQIFQIFPRALVFSSSQALPLRYLQRGAEYQTEEVGASLCS